MNILLKGASSWRLDREPNPRSSDLNSNTRPLGHDAGCSKSSRLRYYFTCATSGCVVFPCMPSLDVALYLSDVGCALSTTTSMSLTLL